MLASLNERARLVQTLSEEVVQRLEHCCEAAVNGGTEQAFLKDICCLCEQHESTTAATATDDEPPSQPAVAQGASTSRACSRTALQINMLPADVLARILRQSLNPDNPGSLCCRSYLNPASLGALFRVTPLRCQSPDGGPAWSRAHLRTLAPFFSRRFLVATPTRNRVAGGSAPLIVVCKLWYYLVKHGDVVRVLAAAAPLGLPSKVQTLFFRLDVLSVQSDSFNSFSRAFHCCMLGGKGFSELRDVVCCSPFTHEKSAAEMLSSGVIAFVPLLQRLPSLTRLDLSHCIMSSSDLERLQPALAAMTQLRSLSVSHANSFEGGMQFLAPALGCLTDLTHLDLGVNTIRAEGLQHLLPYLSRLTALESLNLEDNHLYDLDEEDSIALAEFIKGLTTLKDLNLHGLSFDWDHRDTAIADIAALPGLTSLNLDFSELGNDGADVLKPVVTSSLRALRRLSLQGAFEDTDGARALAPRLAALPLLESLNLSENPFDDAGMRALTPHLYRFVALTSLNLGQTELDDEAMRVLAPHLHDLAGLQELLLDDNLLNEDAMRALAPYATGLKSLRILDVSNNALDNVACPDLANVLASLTRLEVINTLGNDICSAGIQALAPALRMLRHLEVMSLTLESIDLDAALTLVPYIRQWTSLTHLGVRLRDKQTQLVVLAHLTDAAFLPQMMTSMGIDEGFRAEWLKMRALWTASDRECIT